MNWTLIALVVSLAFNTLLIWYTSKVLSKLLYTSDNLGDLYAIFRHFESFVTSLYQMEMFYGEPIIEELIARTKMVHEEIHRFEEIYSLTTDTESLEEELLEDEREEAAP